MTIRTIETIVQIDADRRLIVQLPSDVPLGRHRLVAVLDEAIETANGQETQWKFPVMEGAEWPPGLVLCREDLYGD